MHLGVALGPLFLDTHPLAKATIAGPKNLTRWRYSKGRSTRLVLVLCFCSSIQHSSKTQEEAATVTAEVAEACFVECLERRSVKLQGMSCVAAQDKKYRQASQ